jgi:nicotinamide riboside transporter PnuC
MQQSELLATAMVLVFFIVLAAVIGYFVWRAKKLEHEERRLMIEKGMTPPTLIGNSWPQVKQQENQLRFEERRLMIEKGMVPPPDVGQQGERWQRDDFLRRGLVCFFLGIGLGITYYLQPETTVLAFVSPTLALFGLACVVYYAVSKPSGVNPSAK